MALFLARPMPTFFGTAVDAVPLFILVRSYDDLPLEAVEYPKAATRINRRIYELYVMPGIPMDVVLTSWKQCLQSIASIGTDT